MVALTRWLAALGLACLASMALLRRLDPTPAAPAPHDDGGSDVLDAVFV